MRIWSLHPELLDRAGLVALWREGLLAQKVLQGETKGYRSHPQLTRFRETGDPVAAICTYLWGVLEEATARGYHFDASKLSSPKSSVSICVTKGQLQFERDHLRRKLRLRDPKRLRALNTASPKFHPMLRVIKGGVERWEAI